MSVSGEITEFERLWILQFTEAHRRRTASSGRISWCAVPGLIYPH